jgi:hypothetical protein
VEEVNMSKHRNLLIGSAVALIVVAGISFAVNYFKHSNQIQLISVSWDYNYQDIKELTQNSDLIALVSVQK